MFLDPCNSLNTFEATAQTDPEDDEYSGTSRLFTLNRFTVEPSHCADTITYDCTEVLDPNGEDVT